MLFHRAAIRRVPRYALVAESAIDWLEDELELSAEALQHLLDTSNRDFERRQPALAKWCADQLASIDDELAQSLGYFLAVTVFMAFGEAHPARVSEITPDQLGLAIATLELDEELRLNDPAEVLESDDVIAMGQPTLVEYVQHHVEEAVDQGGDDVDLRCVERVYRLVLIAVIALSHAVGEPGAPASSEVLLS